MVLIIVSRAASQKSRALWFVVGLVIKKKMRVRQCVHHDHDEGRFCAAADL